jgi:hypothetical protein
MKKVLLALALLGFASGAMADPADLNGGCFIAHYCEPIGYSTDPPASGLSWCDEYMANHAITDHTQQVNRVDTSDLLLASWYVIAAWYDEEKEWCGTEFGFGDYTAEAFYVDSWAGCYPPDGGLEIPTSDWPGPNEGIAFVVTGASWTGNYVPVMHFGGYVYSAYGATQIPLAVDPPTDFVGFSNCAAPPEPFAVDPERLGALGINMDGIYVEPYYIPPPEAACCLPGPDYPCQVMTEDECIQAGGEWLGPEFPVCEPNPCIPPGACCLANPLGICQPDMMEDDCNLLGGTWQGPETTCEPNPCEDDWVCCHGCDGQCVIVRNQIDCEEGPYTQPIVFHPEWNSCDPNPCPVPTPVEDTSWGTIKGMYR